MNDHPQAKVSIEFEVDEGLKSLITRLWNLGLMTEYSCQDNMGTAYILFPKEMDAKIFAYFLHENNLRCYFSKREPDYGGGATVDFNPNDLAAIEAIFNSMADTGYWNFNTRKKFINFEPHDIGCRSKLPKPTLYLNQELGLL